MTLDARRGGMRPGQRERGLRGVVETGRGPGCGGVAELAILRESCRHVVGALGRLIV